MGKEIDLSRKTITEDKDGNALITGKVSAEGAIVDAKDLTTKEYVDTQLDNKSFVYLTQAEYDALTEEEQNNESIVYQIIDGQISYNDLVDTPSLVNFATKDYVTDAINRASIEGGGGGDINFDAYALKSDLHSHSNKSILDNITQGDITNWNSKTSFSGNYNDLINKPTVPTKLSQLTNDRGYLTNIPSEYVTETELSNKEYVTQDQLNATLNNLQIKKMTQAEYDQLAVKDPNTLYLIIE